MCIRDSRNLERVDDTRIIDNGDLIVDDNGDDVIDAKDSGSVSYTHLRAHETVLDLVCRLLLDQKNKVKVQTKHSLNVDKENMHEYTDLPITQHD